MKFVLLSIPPFPQSSLPSLLPCLTSDKVGQHYTSVQHAGREEGEDLSSERVERWMGTMGRGKREVRESAKL